MDYRLEKKDGFQLTCKRKQVAKPQGELTVGDISAFWGACTKDDTIEAICKSGRFDNLHGVLGVWFSGEMSDAAFPYAIGAELEVYPSAEVSDPNYTCEIWIAVKEKQLHTTEWSAVRKI